MNSRTWMSTIVMCLFAALAITTQLSAQDTPHHHHQYKLTQVMPLVGPDSDGVVGPGGSFFNSFNRRGATVGVAATDTVDPFYPNCWYDCFVDHAIVFENGTLTDLGAIPGDNSSASFGINDSGLVVGASENGSIDPLTGFPEYHAVVWRHGVLSDLGTFGGSVSQAFAVNAQGRVVGVAANAVPDQYANGLGPCVTWFCSGTNVATQQRAFLWERGNLQDLGTLGTGNDAAAYFVNERGQVAGISYTNTTPNPTTGLPTQDPFLWADGKMVDLGGFGGAYGIAYGFNNQGQVAGLSDLAGDQSYHPFLWDRGVLMDLGTLGGDQAYGYGINDAGDVVGASSLSGNQLGDAFLWHQGVMTDLGLLPGYTVSYAIGINVAGQIVGGDCDDITCSSGSQSAFLWENGGPMVDLNALVQPTNLHMDKAYAIADSGEILAYATLPNGDVRIAVLTPDGDCDSDCERRIAAPASDPALAVQASQVTTTTISNAPVSGKGATGRRPNLFGPRQLTSPQRAVPSN